MNKLFTKIAALCLGATMAVGVGVAVGSASNAKVANAASSYTITFTGSASESTTISTSTTAASITGSSSYVTGNVAVATKAYGATSASGIKLGTSSAAGSIKINLSTTGQVTPTSVVVNAKLYNSGKAATLGFNGSTKQSVSSSFSDITFNYTTALTYIQLDVTKYVWVKSVTVNYQSSTPLTGITLGGAASANAMSIGSSDLTAKTVSVTLNPSGATDQKVNIAHQSGTSGLFTVSSSATCSSGSGSFTVTGKGNTSGSETFRVSGNTETSVYVDLVVTAIDDSVTHWAVSFDTDGGSAVIADMEIEDGDTFEFPSPGTKDHYSFDGWSSDGGNTLYDAGDESPAVGDDIEYTAYWTEDSKYTVTYVHGDHGTGSNYVVNNVYGGSYTLVTFATAGFEASSGYSFKKWSVGGVEYAEGATVTISGATTVTAVYQEVTTYTIVTNVNTLVDGAKFVLVGYASSTYRIDKDLNSGHIKMNAVTAATTISNGTSSGSTLVSTEADEYTLKGSAGAWEIVNSSGEYLQFTGTSNGNDSFTSSSSADTKFSISLTDGKVVIASNSRSSRYLYYNTSTGDLRNYGGTSSSVIACYMFAYIPPQNELSSIALSGDYKTSFASGDTFSFGGTVTASYTIAADANVTSSTTFHLDSASGTNMSGVTMTHAAHDGHTIYAKYTEGGITKTATYSITVANAPVSSLTIASNTGKVALNEYFDMSEIGVTILPADAVQTYEWTVLSNTVNDDYEFDADIVAAKNTAGTITLKCTSTADSSKYQTFVLTVSGNPVVTLPNSVTLYTGKTTTVTASVEGGTAPYSYSWSITSGGSYASISSGGSSATVTLSGTAAGSVTLQCSVTDSNSKSDSASVTFSVIASAVTSVNWSASAFDVFSGATIPSNIDDTWEVNYEKNNGDADYIFFGDYDLYLGSKHITSLPYTFVAEDDGKTLHVEYGGVSSSSVAVAVTQTINNVYAEIVSKNVSNLTFEAQYSTGGATADDGVEWTVTSDGTESTYDATKGIHYGTGSAAVQYIRLNTSDISSGTITKVVVNASTASGVTATVGVKVGGDQFGDDPKTLTSSAAEYTFEDEIGADEIEVEVTKASSAVKAIYVKSVVVTYETSSGSQQIANNASHKAAQKAAVAYAMAFNAAMDETENCTTGLDAAWATCSSAYTSFKSAAAALGETEEAWAKNLVKYATAQYSDDSGEACIERMMKTYEICVQKHGKTAFMSDLVSLNRVPNTSPIAILGNSTNANAVAIVVITSVISLTAIGGYFFLRKRREQN